MEGGNDSCEASRAVIGRLYDLAEGEASILPSSEEWADIRRRGEAMFADDVEHVTRDGTLRGASRLFDDLEVQLRHSTIAFDVRRLLCADDGSVVAVVKIHRRSRQNPKDHMWVLAGAVYRVRGGLIVFIEGYADARRALEAVDLDPALIG